MATISDLLNNLKTLLDKFYVRKQKNEYNLNGVVVTNNNREITTVQSLSANGTMISGLSTVATSGNFSDLNGKPTKVSDFTNDANYIPKGTGTNLLLANGTTIAQSTFATSHTHPYLPLSGGTLTGNVIHPIDSNSSTNTATGNLIWGGTLDYDNDMWTTLRNKKSLISTISVPDDKWYNVISVRHRNGSGDGNNYGMYLKTALQNDDGLIWAKQKGASSFMAERTLLDSSNYSTYANKTTIANNLTTTTTGSALDATQGKALNDKIGQKVATAQGSGAKDRFVYTNSSGNITTKEKCGQLDINGAIGDDYGKIITTGLDGVLQASDNIRTDQIVYDQASVPLNSIIDDLYALVDDSVSTYQLSITNNTNYIKSTGNSFVYITKVGRFCFVEFGFVSNNALPASGNSIYDPYGFFKIGTITDSDFIPPSNKYFDCPSDKTTLGEVRLQIKSDGDVCIRGEYSKKFNAYGSGIYSFTSTYNVQD